MPPDLLVPAFVLVLVANAVLIVLAMRSLMPGRDGADQEAGPVPRAERTESTTAPATREAPATIAASATSSFVVPPDPEAPSEAGHASAPMTTTTAKAAAVGTATDAPGGTSTVARGATAPTARKPATKTATRAGTVAATTRAATRPRRPPVAGAAGAAGATSAGGAGAVAATGALGAAAKSSRRRRFSLPPLDDDHEKVNRSIESFLASGEPAPDADAAPTTVALVALAPSTADGPIDRAVAETLERELRAAARGTDRVERIAPERWQVTLAATGELAARAYLRAVRAAMEPALDDRHRPLRLVAATATVLDAPVADATATAERRLVAALGASGTGGTVATSEPRAAGD
jgi:hypothetical protein